MLFLKKGITDLWESVSNNLNFNEDTSKHNPIMSLSSCSHPALVKIVLRVAWSKLHNYPFFFAL